MSNKIEFAIGNLAICSIILATHHDFPEPVLPTITACRWNSLSPSKNASAFSSIEYFPIERGVSYFSFVEIVCINLVMFSPSIGKHLASISGTVSSVLLNTFSFSPCLFNNVPIKFTFRIFSVKRKLFNPKSSPTGCSSSVALRVIRFIIPIKYCPAFELLIATK